MQPLDWIVVATCVLATLWLFLAARLGLRHRSERRFDEMLSAFGKAVELRAPTSAGHTEALTQLCREVAHQMQLPPDRTRKLLSAIQLRNIGLCAIPYGLLNGAEPSDWSAAERAVYARHPEISAAMLELVPSLQHLAGIVREHHRDARPAGHETEMPPLEARILRASEEYLLLCTERGERVAQDAIEAGVGTRYCPAVAKALGRVLRSKRASAPGIDL